ncbi:MAG: cysteine desulfurase [Oscillospiraceae bacterium]|nr:cysteine desulfurase [Oscillospiraceae bacterium]
MIYLDYAATTPVSPAAADTALRLMRKEFGNPSSLHRMGFEAGREIETARGAIAASLGAAPEEIVFTGSGTHANNLAVIGGALARKRRGNRVVVSALEHASVARAAEELSRLGFEVKRALPADIPEICTPDTVLVASMAVNNETGEFTDIAVLTAAVREKAPHALVHTDAVQAYGKVPLNVGTLGVDTLAVSAHKVSAPKGCGALYVRRGTRLQPLTFGGGQENGLHPGTQAVPLIGAFGAAVREMKPFDAGPLYQELSAGLKEMGAAVYEPPRRVPDIVTAFLPGVRAQTMVQFLSDRGIFISAGAACGRGKPSEVLMALGLPPVQLNTAVRVSFGKDTALEEVNLLLEALWEGCRTLVKA